MNTESKVFLQKKSYFILTLAVITTTLFSWFNLNSYCIILLLLCRLLEGGPLTTLKTAFSNKFFLAYFALFLVEALGFLYTHHLSVWGHIVEKNATLVAIPFILCAGPFTDERGYKKLMSAYCLLLFITAVYCLAVAVRNYLDKPSISVFFYHSLSHAIRENAIFYSAFLIFGLLFLLSGGFDIGEDRLSAKATKRVQVSLAVFFMIMILLLASKLLLITVLLILASFLFQKYSFQKHRAVLLGMGLGGILLILGVVFTDNPVKYRYMDMIGDVSVIKKEKFSPGTYFNGIQLRLLEWRFAIEILNEHHAWLQGVSPGDSQDLLSSKYIKADMYLGDPNRKDSGFLTYNFHNQYVETLVRSGLVGLCVLLTLCWLLIRLAWKRRTLEAIFSVSVLLLLFLPESVLTLQHGVFAFAFFPLLQLYSPKKPLVEE